MRKKRFLQNLFIMTCTSIFLSIISISFRVYISKKIGAEAMGLYQLISSVFVLSATFAVSGITIAVTRLVSAALAKGESTAPIVKAALIISQVTSLGFGSLLYIFSKFIALHLLNDGRTFLSIRLLSLILPFLAFSACLHGYFIAKRKGGATSADHLVKTLIEVSVVISILRFFMPKGLEYACLALVIGMCVGEIISCTYAFLGYFLEEKRENTYLKKRPKGILRKLLSISIPTALSSYLRTVLITTENILIPRSLIKSGLSRESALSQFGMIKAMTIPVLFFPAAFLGAFSRLLIPEISDSKALNHVNNVRYTVSRVFQITLIFSICICGVFLFYSKELSMAIYGDNQVGHLLKIFAPLIPLMYLDDIADAMLRGLDYQMSLLKINVFDSMMRLAIIYFLIPLMSTNGFILALYVSNIINPLLSIRKIIHVVKLKANFFNWIFKPCLCSVLSCLVAKFLPPPFYFHIAIPITISVFAYFILLKMMRVVSPEDIRWIKTILK